jgi:protein tyrosine phosphatase (PTP) superfamily phosphohydrolase (DUF442 family)
MKVLLSFFKRITIALLCFALASLAVAGGFYLWVNYNGNFHTVQEGELYRSAQLDANALAEHIAKEHIKTVVNLRGANPDKPWYQAQSNLAKSKGVVLIDIPLSSSQRIKPDDARAYVDLIKSAPKPVLVHCLNGSDRTGFISAVYLIQNGVDEITAAQQLSIKFGHFPHGPWVDTQAMDQSLNAFIGTLLPGSD